ncbi:MAG: hypothetical protein H6662_13155 [Ardenticatenaceae bacterium]|nr:hypothetical protein [Ardenticatenaceae bacterium]
MRELLRAEWQKTVGNRWVTGLLLWIFPIGGLALAVLLPILTLLLPPLRQGLSGRQLEWTTVMINTWQFPNNPLGRIFLLGLTAVSFAGEYQWQTWKNIVPRQRRVPILASKFIILAILILFAFALLSIFLAIGEGLRALVGNASFGPALTADTLQTFLRSYTLSASITFLNVMITAIYAALAAILTRTILGGVMVGIAISILEPSLLLLLLALRGLFDKVEIIHLYRFTPIYNIGNLTSWVESNGPTQTLVYMLGNDTPADSVQFSLIVLAAWVTIGVTLLLLWFRRQDIT